eukprot:g375.t1
MSRSAQEKLAAQYLQVQKRAFLKWTNIQLRRAKMQIDSLDTGFKDGVALCTLCEVISGEKIGKRGWTKRPKNNIQMLENITTALKFLHTKLKLVGIGNRSIYEGNITLILGLLWTIILRFQVAEISIAGISGKKGLLLWAQKNTKHRKADGVHVRNFHTSWKDGLGFCALIEKFRPDLMDFDSLDKTNAKECLEKAFTVAEKELGIPAVLDPEDLMVPRPDEKTVMLYVSELFKYFSQFAKMDSMVNGVKDAIAVTMRHDEKIGDYIKNANDIKQWIASTEKKFENDDFGSQIGDVEKLLGDFQQYRKHEKPRVQGQLFALEGIYGSILNSQRHNKRPLYKPDDSITIETLEKDFGNLVSQEDAYEQAIRDLYVKYRKYTFLLLTFKAKREQVSQWIEDKAGGVEELADAETKVETIVDGMEAAKKTIRFLEDADWEKERYTPIMKELAELASQIKEPFHAAKIVRQEVTTLQETCDEVLGSLVDQKKSSSDTLQRLEDLLKKQDDYRKETAVLVFNIGAAEERLKEPVVEESVKAVEDHKAKIEALVADCKPKFASGLSTAKGDFVELSSCKLKFDDLRGPDELEASVAAFEAAATKRLGELEEQLQLEKDRDDVRGKFADAANAMQKTLEGLSDKLLATGGSGDDAKSCLATVNDVAEEHEAAAKALENVKALADEQDKLDVVVNELTKATAPALVAKHMELGNVISKMRDDLEAQISGNSGEKLSKAQQKDLKKMFNTFDEDNSGSLKPKEFHTACTAMGIVLTDEETDDLFKKGDKDGSGDLDWDQFLGIMEDQLLTSSSKEDVLSSFKTMAGGKDNISTGTIKKHFGNFAGVFGFIGKNIGEKGDYKALTEEIFSR